MPYSTEQFLHDRFMRDNGHLISPWAYSAAMAKKMSETLLRLSWMRSSLPNGLREAYDGGPEQVMRAAE